MDIEGTYGDELTLRAFVNIFNIEIESVSIAATTCAFKERLQRMMRPNNKI